MANADSVVRARIETDLKTRATAVLADMGLSISDAIRLMLVRVAADRALPFEVKAPNAATVAALQEADRGPTARFDSVEDLMADLNADD